MNEVEAMKLISDLSYEEKLLLCELLLTLKQKRGERHKQQSMH